MVEDFLFKSSDHEFLTSYQVSVSRPVLKRTLRKWQKWPSVSKTEKKKNIWQNYFPQDHWSLYPAYKHDKQTRSGFGLVCANGMYLPLGTWFFRNFKQEFLLNGKRVKCLRGNVGSARKLTLPLQKGDRTRWVTLLAEPTFCNLNGSPCFVKKCVKRCLFQESSGRRVTLLLETNFLHISGA